MTLQEVKSDLKQIRYYYAHEKEFEGATRIIGGSGILEKIEKYNTGM